MKIQVIGSGCPTCKKLHEITQKALDQMGVKEKAEYLTGDEGMRKIIEMGVMQSPVLAINGHPAMIGFTSDIEKIKKLISDKTKTQNISSKCDCGGNCC